LYKVAELGFKEKSVSLPVVEKLGVHSEVGVACIGVPGRNRFGKIVGGAGVHALPIRERGRRSVLQDMILQGVLPDSEEELITPPARMAGTRARMF